MIHYNILSGVILYMIQYGFLNDQFVIQHDTL
jgi:hypothetical protein